MTEHNVPDEEQHYTNDGGGAEAQKREGTTKQEFDELLRPSAQKRKRETQGGSGTPLKYRYIKLNEQMEEFVQSRQQIFQQTYQPTIDQGPRQEFEQRITQEFETLKQHIQHTLDLEFQHGAKRKLELAADKWLKRLEEMALVLRYKGNITGYEPVKVAILDTGIDQDSWYRKRINGYYDLVNQGNQTGIDKTGHGTDMVHLIFKIIPNARIFVARVFETNEAKANTPELMTKVFSS